MKASCYVDIALRGNDETDLSLPVIGNTIFQVLHGAFRTLEHPYAIALPRSGKGRPYKHTGDIIRIFAEHREHLDQLVESVGQHAAVRDYSRILYPKSVPADFGGPWVSYRRYRTTNRNAGREESTLSARRTAYAAEKGLPYFKVWSKSTERYFSLFIESVEQKRPSEVQGAPDRYGLCVSTRPFALPDIPAS